MSLALLFQYLLLNMFRMFPYKALQHMKYIHNKSEAPEDGCTNIRNMFSSK